MSLHGERVLTEAVLRGVLHELAEIRRGLEALEATMLRAKTTSVTAADGADKPPSVALRVVNNQTLTIRTPERVK
jgi:hypothetical protein